MSEKIRSGRKIQFLVIDGNRCERLLTECNSALLPSLQECAAPALENLTPSNSFMKAWGLSRPCVTDNCLDNRAIGLVIGLAFAGNLLQGSL